MAGVNKGTFITFDGIVYGNRESAPLKQSVVLNPAWKDLGYNYNNASFLVTGGVVVLSGAVITENGRPNSWEPNVGTIPAEIAPRGGTITFRVSHDENTHQIEVKMRIAL